MKIDCQSVEEELASVVEGTANEKIVNHIADCSSCQDLRHDAMNLRARISAASADYVHPSDIEERIRAKVATLSQEPESTTKRVESEAPASNKKNGRAFGAAGAAALLLAASVFGIIRAGGGNMGWSGEIAELIGPEQGLELCKNPTSCTGAKKGAKVTSGMTLKSGPKTRARITMADGSVLAIDRETEVAFDKTKPRAAKLSRGLLSADIAHRDNDQATVDVPSGLVRVLGTKFDVVVTGEDTRVNVFRGEVELSSTQSKELIRRGEEGHLERGMISVAPSLRTSDADGQGEVEPGGADSLSGLGELRAKKPGEKEERRDIVRLARHDVHVRVSDMFSRTEVDETFTNTTGDQLEGVFRFPIPADAQIERLALEVNGHLEEAAFVEKDKAAAIWRGVIAHATPTTPPPQEEIIWVPGPWRDPALLEWKRGGRFELRIFPIPARGSRRVILAYTQVVPSLAGVRRYTYPLARAAQGMPAVDQASFDVRVVGNEMGSTRASGYGANVTREDNADVARFAQSGFLPAGVFSVEYKSAAKEREVAAYGFAPQNAQGIDASPYAVLALRPNLPRTQEEGFSDHVFVVDASRSMVGERFAQARRLVEETISQTDSRDRVAVLACDSTCQTWPGGLSAVSGTSKALAAQFLSGITPDGSANIARMLVEGKRFAETQIAGEGKRTIHLVYIGDGTASSGPTLPKHLASEVARTVASPNLVLTTVAIGQDADSHALEAVARAGGGLLIPFSSGETARATSEKIALGASGTRLKNASVTLPEGLTLAAPSVVGTIRAGAESLVGVRMTRPSVDGDLVLRGTLGAEPFERRYPIHVSASSEPGNAFVPRLYAGMRIHELEEKTGPDAKSEMIALSKQYRVASPHTSLLVLESEAMFKAFGLEHRENAAVWNGEDAVSATISGGLAETEQKADLGGLGKSAGGPMDLAQGGGSGARASMGGDSYPAPPSAAAPEPAKKAPAREKSESASDRLDGYVGRDEERRASSNNAPLTAPRPSRPITPDFDEDPRPMRRRQMIPMRRIWVRQGGVRTDLGAYHVKNQARLLAAENGAFATPNRRESIRALFAAASQQGDLTRSIAVAEQWSGRDALDVDAIIARADAAARSGNRAVAVRILAGAADVRPDDATLQTRMSDVFMRLGDQNQSCAHRIALAESRSNDVDAVAKAAACTRLLGEAELSASLASEIAAEKRKAFDVAFTKAQTGFIPTATPAADVRLSASWSGAEDLDVALIDSNGVRISCLGGRSSANVEGATSADHENLSVRDLKPGTYLLEVTRTRAARANLVSGNVQVWVSGESLGQTNLNIPFSMNGSRVELGTIEIQVTSRLVPAYGWPDGRP